MKDGIENRPGGGQVRKIIGANGFVMYESWRQTDQGLEKSKNGPWDYLRNARADADGLIFTQRITQ